MILAAIGFAQHWAFAQESHLASTPSCARVLLENFLSPEKVLEEKIHKYFNSLAIPDPQHPYGRTVSFAADFNKLFSQSTTPEELIRAWRMVERLAPTELVTMGAFSSSKQSYSGELLYDLGRFDAVKPVLALRDHFTPAQKTEFLALLDRMRSYAPKSSRDSWTMYAAPFHMIFEPDSVFSYLQHINGGGEYARNYAELHSAYRFHKGTITAMQNLPEKTRQAAKTVALQGYRDSQAAQRLRMEDFGDGQVFKPAALDQLKVEMKKERRNWEAVHRALVEPEFQLFLRSMKGMKKIRVKDLNEAIVNYWTSVGFKNPGYSFSDVYRVAKTLQTGSLSESLQKEDLLLYGSFPNGKATLGTSDIDVHPSPGLMSKYRRAFKDPHTDEGSFANFQRWDKSAPPPGTAKMSTQLLEAERSVANTLKIASYEPAELMTMVLVGPQSDFFRKEMIAQYNPIGVRITRTKIYLEIYDAYKTREQISIEVIPSR